MKAVKKKLHIDDGKIIYSDNLMEEEWARGDDREAAEQVRHQGRLQEVP